MNATRLSRILVDPTGRPPERIVARSASGEELTFSGFLAGVARWRDAARAGFPEGITPADRAILFGDDAARVLPALFGLWAAGLHVVLAGDMLPGVLRQLEQAGVDLSRSALVLDAVRLDPQGRMRRIAEPPETFGELSRAAVPADLAPLDETRPLVSLLTGGSTGRPKLVAKTLRQVFFEPEGIDAGIPGGTDGLGPVDVVGTVSAQHTYGFLFRILWPLSARDAVLAGGRIHFPGMLAGAVAEAAARGRRTVIVTAPAHLKRLASPELFEGLRGHVALVFTSTGLLEEEDARLAFTTLGRFPTEVYGTTETGGIAWRTRRLDGGRLVTPPWRSVAGVRVRAAGPDGPAGEGLVELSGRHAAVAGPDGTPGAGWLTGSDRIRILRTPGDEGSGDGPVFLELLGRADRIVKVEGKRVSLAAMENALVEAGLARRARVFPTTAGRDGSRAGRETLAVVLEPASGLLSEFLAAGKRAVVKRLRSQLSRDFPAVTLPRRWRLVTELPADARGKTTTAALRRLLDPRRPEWLVESDVTADGTRTLSLRFEARPDLEWFRGHFPGRPILPGVAQLILVERAAAEFAGADEAGHPVAVRTLKFRSVTTPGMRIRLVLSLPAAPEARFTTRFAWAEVREDGSERALSSGVIDWAA